MSKYNPLWNWIKENDTDRFKLTYAKIEKIVGLPIDHSFFKYKNSIDFSVSFYNYHEPSIYPCL